MRTTWINEVVPKYKWIRWIYIILLDNVTSFRPASGLKSFVSEGIEAHANGVMLGADTSIADPKSDLIERFELPLVGLEEKNTLVKYKLTMGKYVI